MELKVDSTTIDKALSDLDTLYRDSNVAANSAGVEVINAGYSSVSGLDQLGGGHGAVMDGGTGSAFLILTSYSEQIQWLRNALKASVEALNGQDELFARGMDIADTGGKVGEESVAFPMRPAPRFESFSFSRPMVRVPSSIDQLCSDFSGTNSGAVSAAQSSWTTMSSTISEVSESLNRVASQLLESNSGEVFDQATLRITEVAEAGTAFAHNAKAMAESVGTLNQIYQGHKMRVFLAAMSISAIKDPVERAAAESSYLASFESAFQSDVQAGVPGIDNLMRMKGADGSGGDVALGMSTIAGSGQHFTTQGLNPQGLSAAGGGAAAAHAMGAGSFGTVATNLDGVELSDLQTTAAAVGIASPTMGNTTMPSGIGASGMGAGGAGMGGAAGGNGGPLSAPLMGMAGKPGFSTGGSPRISNSGLNPLMNSRTQSASAMGSMSPMMGASGAGAGAGVGGAGAAGLNASRGQTKQMLAHSGNAASTNATQSASGLMANAAGKMNQGMQRPMMPMMPMGGAGGGAQKNTGKVKSVTSAVEEDANIVALLGDRGPVVPGVIGDWVRR